MPQPFEIIDDRPTAIGLIVLETDELIEPEVDQFFGHLKQRVYHTRIASAPDVTPETLAKMADGVTASASQLPKGCGIGAIGYGCTSGATVIGEDRVASLIGAAHPGMPASNPMSALLAACSALGVQKLGLLTPYVMNVSQALIARLEKAGIEVSDFLTYEQVEETTVARIAPSSTRDALVQIGQGECDAVFASCTNLRAWEIVDEVEAAINKPMLCSNQVLAWHLLRLSGGTETPQGFGRLFEAPLDG